MKAHDGQKMTYMTSVFGDADAMSRVPDTIRQFIWPIPLPMKKKDATEAESLHHLDLFDSWKEIDQGATNSELARPSTNSKAKNERTGLNFKINNDFSKALQFKKNIVAATFCDHCKRPCAVYVNQKTGYKKGMLIHTLTVVEAVKNYTELVPSGCGEPLVQSTSCPLHGMVFICPSLTYGVPVMKNYYRAAMHLWLPIVCCDRGHSDQLTADNLPMVSGALPHPQCESCLGRPECPRIELGRSTTHSAGRV